MNGPLVFKLSNSAAFAASSLREFNFFAATSLFNFSLENTTETSHTCVESWCITIKKDCLAS